jgi:hypothetical protein
MLHFQAQRYSVAYKVSQSSVRHEMNKFISPKGNPEWHSRCKPGWISGNKARIEMEG